MKFYCFSYCGCNRFTSFALQQINAHLVNDLNVSSTLPANNELSGGLACRPVERLVKRFYLALRATCFRKYL